MSLWKNLPRDIIHKIIQLTGKVVYRDNRYIDINKLKGDYAIIEHIYKKQLKFDINFSIDGNAWYLDIKFDTPSNIFRTVYSIFAVIIGIIRVPRHGLYYSFRYDDPRLFQICYYNHRYPGPEEEGTLWIQQRTYFDLKDCAILN